MATGPDDEVTIANATSFYLTLDPLDPCLIPSYRRNLIYIRESRWALLILRGRLELGSAASYTWSLQTHQTIMDSLGLDLGRLADDGNSNGNGGNGDSIKTYSLTMPEYSLTEVEAIYFEELETYFAEEMTNVVCTGACPPPGDANPLVL